jgi:hypothetical protein
MPEALRRFRKFVSEMPNRGSSSARESVTLLKKLRRKKGLPFG